MIKQFIITDPCYIMEEKEYRKICDDGANFEEQKFPFKTKHDKFKSKELIFHTIVGTPNGDGSYHINDKETVAVDSGMLCIAECKKGWNEWNKYQKCYAGATFETLKEAKKALPKILKHF